MQLEDFSDIESMIPEFFSELDEGKVSPTSELKMRSRNGFQADLASLC
jgi:hypothetical protein